MTRGAKKEVVISKTVGRKQQKVLGPVTGKGPAPEQHGRKIVMHVQSWRSQTERKKRKNRQNQVAGY
jgi:hypothetical protein